jgi:hypothetical protein
MAATRAKRVGKVLAQAAGDGDGALLDRLAEHFQAAAVELR